MSISATSSLTSAAQVQATQYRSTSASASATGGTSSTGGTRPPRGGEGFISAIASALSSLGVSSASASTASTSTDTSTTSTDPAQALGDFLHTLMEAMHSQNAGGKGDATAVEGERPPPPPGGGGMEADLQSLIASVSAGASDTTSATSTEDSATSTLQSSFASLLGSLGLDQSNAGSKLSEFLQTLSSKLEANGPSGNLINTTA
jgi:hypothetical protein